MKKIVLMALFLLLSIAIFGCRNGADENPVVVVPSPTDEIDQQSVASLVIEFGQKLQAVPLLADQEIVTKSMQDNYSSFVSPELLAKWQNDPQNAPGRLVSSPWPDRIEITANKKTAADAYAVSGSIIEITSVEQENGGAAARRPIDLVVKKIGDRWLIDAVTMGDYAEATNDIVYKNPELGFSFDLPDSWQGYTIVTGKWEGRALGGTEDGKIIENGEIISIRHPQWTAEIPRQDIPLMIFTLSQWNSLLKEEFSVGAAPMPPSELGRNDKYVFALPARYNYAFPVGFEEVETILQGKPLKPF